MSLSKIFVLVRLHPLQPHAYFKPVAASQARFPTLRRNMASEEEESLPKYRRDPILFKKRLAGVVDEISDRVRKDNVPSELQRICQEAIDKNLKVALDDMVETIWTEAHVEEKVRQIVEKEEVATSKNLAWRPITGTADISLLEMESLNAKKDHLQIIIKDHKEHIRKVEEELSRLREEITGLSMKMQAEKTYKG